MSGALTVLRRPIVALLLDVALVLVFAAVGRASHEESNPVVGAVTTAWPFLVGTALGWVVVRLSRHEWPVQVSPGVTVWFSTVLVGLVLRRATGQGTALSFVIVAALVLGLLLLGWRALLAHASRRRPTVGD